MKLRVAMIEDFDCQVLPAWIKSLQENYSQCSFEILSGVSHEIHASLSSRRVDMIVAGEMPDEVDWIERHALLRDPFILVTARPDDKNSSMDDLMQRTFVRYSSNQIMSRQVEAQLRRTKHVPPEKFQCSMNQTVYAMVKALDGWAITSSLGYVTCVPDGGKNFADLHAYPLPIPEISRRLSLFSRHGTLGKIPAEFASELCNAIQTSLLPVIDEKLPFIRDGFQIGEISKNKN